MYRPVVSIDMHNIVISHTITHYKLRIQVLNDCRNIQEVVRLAFKSLHDLVKAQAVEISTLRSEMEQRPTRAEVRASHTAIHMQLDLIFLLTYIIHIH